MIENRRIPWVGIGVLVVILMIVTALCCLWSPGSSPGPPPCDVPPPPVIVPAHDTGVPDDAGSPCDAAPEPQLAVDAGFDVGPSCGTHPWCPHPKKPCCRDERDCCSS